MGARMARSYGKLLASVWIDPDWCDLSIHAQWLVIAVLGQPRTRRDDGVDFCVQRFAGLAAGMPEDDVLIALDELIEWGMVTLDNGVLYVAPWLGCRPLSEARMERARMSPQLREQVLARDGAKCRACGATDRTFEIDHLHPVARGGTTDLDNLAVLCAPCNRSKSTKSWAEFMAQRAAL